MLHSQMTDAPPCAVKTHGICDNGRIGTRVSHLRPQKSDLLLSFWSFLVTLYMKTKLFGSFSPGDTDMPAYSDEKLVLEALDDSHQAFGQLVKQYQYRVLRTIASIISDREAAQDIAQETFLSAWSNLAKLKEQQKFGRWLNQIAVSFSKRWLRDQRKYHENTVSLDEDAIVLTQKLRYQREKLRQEIWEAIDELAADHREVVILHYISGYSYREIAQMLSVPVSTIQGRLQKARNQLRKEFLDMVTKLQLEIDSTVHKFLKEHAKQHGLSIEALIVRLIERYKRDIDKPHVSVRQVWESSREPLMSDDSGAPSPDGRYLSFTEWGSANLAVRDLITGECRILTDEGTWNAPVQWAGSSRWSPDGKQIAYGWYKADQWELRIVGLDGSEPRVLYRREYKKGRHIHLHAWSQDGKSILVDFKGVGGASEIALVSVANGSARVLKSLKSFFREERISLAPDRNHVVYARPVEEHDGARDIFLLATDGSGEETPLEEHPADDYGPVWTPDGKGIVFVSDRSGAYDLWLMQVVDGKPVGEPQIVKKDIGGIWGMRPMGFTQEGSFYYGLRSGPGGYSTDIYIASIDPATGELLEPPKKAIRQFEGSNHSPAWSPDGKSLAYVSSRSLQGSRSGHRAVLVIRSEETGEERELYPEVELGDLRWSPDGRSILSMWEHQTPHLIDVRTGDVTSIVQLDPTDEVGIGRSWWSSDGKVIFYIRRAQEGPSLIAHDLKTGKEKELGGLPDPEEVKAASLTDPVDGQQVPCLHPKCGLVLLSVGGGEPRARILLRPQNKKYFAPVPPVATPDGRYILFCRKKDDQSRMIELCRIPAKGGEPQKLMDVAEAPPAASYISVHPDGQHIAFTTGHWQWEVWAIESFLPGFTASRQSQ